MHTLVTIIYLQTFTQAAVYLEQQKLTLFFNSQWVFQHFWCCQFCLLEELIWINLPEASTLLVYGIFHITIYFYKSCAIPFFNVLHVYSLIEFIFRKTWYNILKIIERVRICKQCEKYGGVHHHFFQVLWRRVTWLRWFLLNHSVVWLCQLACCCASTFCSFSTAVMPPFTRFFSAHHDDA